MKQEQHMTDDILAAYLLGEATEAEQQQVLQWMNEDPAHKKRFYELKLVWNESRKLQQEIAVDADAAWERFMEKVNGTATTRAIPLRRYGWLKVAAILILLLGGGFMTYTLIRDNGGNDAAQAVVTASGTGYTRGTAREDTATVNPAQETPQQEEIPGQQTGRQEPAITGATEKIPQHSVLQNEPLFSREKAAHTTAANDTHPHHAKAGAQLITTEECKTKKFICNSTACPLEICIVQKNNCEGGRPILYCSIIQPDESGRVCYKGADEKLFENCVLAVEEIRIKRVSTGETIVLRRQTAQEVFSYITRQKRGDIVAGVFESDCNNNFNDHSLTIDNQYGNLLFR